MSLPLATIAARIVTLPGFSFPRTLHKLDRMLSDPECSSAVVGAVISSDPVLTALCIGRAASMSQSELTQVSSAVMILGLSPVQLLIREVPSIDDAARKLLAGCWSMANACGTMARIIATYSPAIQPIRPDDETMHVAGLLHDLGTMMAIAHFRAEYDRAIERLEHGEGSFNALLKEELGADSGELGAITARAWNLPPLLATCARHHQRPLKADAHVELVVAVHLARSLVRACGFCAGRDVYLEPIDVEAMTLLGLRLSHIEDALVEFYDEMAELELYEGLLVLAHNKP